MQPTSKRPPWQQYNPHAARKPAIRQFVRVHSSVVVLRNCVTTSYLRFCLMMHDVCSAVVSLSHKYELPNTSGLPSKLLYDEQVKCSRASEQAK